MKRSLKCAVAAVAALAASANAAVPFDRFVAFGASYTDSGQFPDPELGFDRGLRFTNVDPETGTRGLSFAEWLSIDLGIGPLDPSTPLTTFGPRSDLVDTDNINFAVGGYRADQILASVVGDSVVNFGPFSEIEPGFLARVAGGALTVTPNTLYFANIGGNDIRDVRDPVATAAISGEIVAALVDAGARFIVLPNLPRLGQFAELANLTPDGRSELAAQRTAAALAFNAAFEQQLNAIDGNFIRVDVLTLFDELLADPSSYGFSAAVDQTRECYSTTELSGGQCNEPAGLGKSSGGSPDGFFFQDGLHPTQQGARIAADLMEAVILAPGIAALLPEAALGDARAYLNTVSDHLAQNRWNAPARGLQLFASVQGARVDVDEARSTPAADADAVDLSLGGSYALGGGWFVGASIGSQSSETDIDDRGSEFETSGLLGSLFAGYRCNGLFYDLVLTVGKTELDNIDRVYNLGSIALRKDSGDTEADVFGASANLGLNVLNEDSAWRFGPILGLDYFDVEVDGYAERGTWSSAMAFGDQDRESLVGSVGAFASYPLQFGDAALEVYADLSYQEEFEDNADDVKAVVKTLQSGPWFQMPGYDIDSDAVRGTLGVAATWNNGMNLGLSYRYTDNDAESRYLNLTAAYRF